MKFLHTLLWWWNWSTGVTPATLLPFASRSPTFEDGVVVDGSGGGHTKRQNFNNWSNSGHKNLLTNCCRCCWHCSRDSTIEFFVALSLTPVEDVSSAATGTELVPMNSLFSNSNVSLSSVSRHCRISSCNRVSCCWL